MEKKSSISLCMIVKNEEESISRCLDSIQNLVDEIIIVDTGSTDRTKEICEKYNSKIYNYTWDESFSNARNFGLTKATKEWILFLDADEEIIFKNLTGLKKLLNSTAKKIFLIPIINYYGTFPTTPKKSYLFASQRLFKNHSGFKFIGSIHEHLNIRDFNKDFINEIDIIPNIEIHHYGYMDSVIKEKDKSNRNLNLLEKERDSFDYDPWIDYHIASEYYNIGRYEIALKELNLSIIRFLQNGVLPPSLLYKLKYEILINTKNYSEAKAGINKAILLYPEYVDLHFYKGIILFEEKSFQEAISVFKHCIKLGETNLQHLILAGNGSYTAWYFIGCCYENLGNYKKAFDSYTKAINIYPDYDEAQLKLSKLPKFQN